MELNAVKRKQNGREFIFLDLPPLNLLKSIMVRVLYPIPIKKHTL